MHKQNWEFYAVNASLFVVFAYPLTRSQNETAFAII